MPKQIRLNAFLLNGPPHMAPGYWTHPRDQSHRFNDLEHWIGLAQLLERGKLDGLFIADGLGVNDLYQGGAAAALAHGMGVPINDPLQLVPAMAAATRHLGFAITCSVAYEQPFAFARRMSTLDHLTKGRAAWNIVTSYLGSGARNMGQTLTLPHDERYEMAEEYVEVCYKLWEGSWEDEAVVLDRARRLYSDPSRVHDIGHAGRYFTVPGFHLSQPSPQRTPVLYQAGASGRGIRFAARHAECVFAGAGSLGELTAYVKALRESAASQGRDPTDILVFNATLVVLGRTDAEARDKFAEYRSWFSYDATLTMLSGYLGIDLGKFAPGDYLDSIETNAIQSFADQINDRTGERYTVRRLAESFGLGQALVGSPASVADQLQEYVEASDCDGFNLGYVVFPETFVDIVELLVPELQRRGAFKREYASGTFREKLFDRGPRLRPPHPAAGYRRPVRP